MQKSRDKSDGGNLNYSEEAQYDEQGGYFWSLCMEAGWNRERVEMLMLQKYKKSHWNILTEKQKRQMIVVMKKYADNETKKKQNAENSQLRKNIMAIWSATGHSLEELHALMKDWGFGESLRACNKFTLFTIMDSVRDICSPVKKK